MTFLCRCQYVKRNIPLERRLASKERQTPWALLYTTLTGSMRERIVDEREREREGKYCASWGLVGTLTMSCPKQGTHLVRGDASIHVASQYG